jgi:hypothetical protein
LNAGYRLGLELPVSRKGISLLHADAEVLEISVAAEMINVVVEAGSDCEGGASVTCAAIANAELFEDFEPSVRGGTFLVIEAFDQPKTADQSDVKLEILRISYKSNSGPPAINAARVALFDTVSKPVLKHTGFFPILDTA